MTDRASAEGLPGYWTLREMRYHPDLKDKSPDYVAGWDAATRTLAALRDTGPRPDSDHPGQHHFEARCTLCGIRGQLRVALVGDDESFRIERALSTPRTETSEP